MTRLACLLTFILSLSLPLPLMAAGPAQAITHYETDPVVYFVKTGNSFAIGGETAVSDLPGTPVPVVREEPNGFLMIKYNGQQMWFDPMDVTTSTNKTAAGCQQSVGTKSGLRNFATHGIGENQ